MAPFGWTDCPDPIKAQVGSLGEGLAKVLGGNLAGVYLHGSLALGCYNPLRSAVDLTVVCRERLSPAEKHHLGRLMINLSLHPAPLAVHFLPASAVQEWHYPVPFDYFYNEAFRLPIENTILEGGTIWEGEAVPEPLLAIHLFNIRKRGIVRAGPPANRMFAAPPAEDLLDAFFQQVMTVPYQDPASDHPVDVLLNSCRVYAYIRTTQLYSKKEAGTWALHGLPAEHHALLERALTAYAEKADDRELDRAGLEGLLAFFQADFRTHAALPI